MNPVDPNPSAPVAIIGMACLFPKADSLSGYWASIRNRTDAITEVPPTHWRPDDYFDADPRAPDRTYARRGGFLDAVDFPPLDFGIAPNNLEATDTTQLLGLLVARQALEDAGYGEASDKPLDRSRVSVILGVTGTLELVIPLGARLGHPIWRRALAEAGVPEDQSEEVVRRISASYPEWQENSFPGLLGNVAAGRIANRLDLGGTNCVIDAACASSVGALNLALLELGSGRCDMALSGGLDTFNDIFMYMCFSKTPALSPTGDARPFDAGCDGTILGEGLGVVVLKRLDDARRDGDRVYAVIRAVGASSDGKGNAVYAPSAAGQARALRQAYQLAGCSPATIELIEAHGTGTKVGDATELSALHEVYRAAREGATWCALGSVKSQIGHTKAAAGAAGLIKAALALHHKVLPPTIKVTKPLDGVGPGSSPFYINTEPRPWLARPDHPRRAALSAFGFGGSNYHCVLEEADPVKGAVDWDGAAQILAFSAKSREALRSELDAWPQGLSWDGLRAEAAATRQRFRHDDPHRLVLVADRSTDLESLRSSARAALEAKDAARARPGVFQGHGRVPGKLGLLFPGQGAQYVGMLREVSCQFPQAHDALETFESVRSDANRLVDRIYPLSAFTETEWSANEAALRATDVAQPAIGAVSLGLFRVLASFGVKPDAVAGHSFGELTALCAAGWVDDSSFAMMARERGRLMAAEASRGGGAMLAVLAPIGVVEDLLAAEQLAGALVVANKNGPRQFVVSGPAAAIDQAARAFEARGVTARKLAVSAAFHSPDVAAASVPFLETLRGVAVTPTALPVFANTTAAPYPADADAARALLADQLARPVEFAAMVEAMADAGVTTFLEVGPDTKLTGMVRAILDAPGRPARAIAVDASRTARGNLIDLASALAELASLGYPVNLARWDQADEHELARPKRAARKPALTVKVSGANVTPGPAAAAGRATPARKATPRPTAATAAVAVVERPTPSSPTPPVDSTMSRRTAPPHRSPVIPRPTNALSNGAAIARNGKPPETPAAGGNGFTTTAKRPAVPASGDHGTLSQALRNTQDSLVALQRLSEQTAALHRQFLENQEQVQRNFQSLLDQQQRLTLTSIGAVVPLPATPLHVAAPPTVEPPPAPAPVQEQPVAPAPSASEPAPGPSAVGSSEARTVLLAVVADKTGYPVEMLEPAMLLDADLGIDSIKRVEILSALQERLPNAPPVKPEHLGTLRSLQDIIEFLAAGAAEMAPAAAKPDAANVAKVMLEVVAEKTGYPVEMLEPAMLLDADLGIDSIKRVEILSALQERLPDAPPVKPEQLGTLRSLQDIIEFLAGGTPQAIEPAKPATVAEAPTGPSAAIQRLIVRAVPLPEAAPAPGQLAAGEHWVLDDGSGLAAALVKRLVATGARATLFARQDLGQVAPPQRLAALVLVGAGGDEAVKDAFCLLRACAPALRGSRDVGRTRLVTVSRLDGAFGTSHPQPDADPASGGLAGLAKTAGHEWPEVDCKAIDVDPTMAVSEAAGAIIAELGRPGPVEVGLSKAGRTTLALVNVPIHAAAAGATPLAPGDVVVITGGARGVTAEVAEELAGAFRPTLVLFGRSPAPEEEPEWLSGLETEAEIKRALAAESSGSPSPSRIGEQYRRIAAAREIRRHLERMAIAGARVVYRQVDVRDAVAVTAAIDEIRKKLGPIRGLVHGAGVLADRRIEDKTDEQFAAVYDTKVAGLRALLAAVHDDELRVLALFSSSTARFGRTGQVAYAAANEVLNKLAQREAIRRPGCRVVSVNWGPWDGGMVTPSLRAVFAGEGIGLIPLRAGARYLVDELKLGGERPVEVVVLGGSALPAALTGPITPAPPQPEPVRPAPADPTSRPLTTVFERPLELAALPVLRSHVIDGHGVLPMALSLEWLVHGALQRNPGLTLHSVDDLRLLKGAVLQDGPPETLAVAVAKAIRDGSCYRVAVELQGRSQGGRTVAHVRAEVVLANRPDQAGATPSLPPQPVYSRSTRSIYHDVLFHGPELQGIEHVETLGGGGATAIVRTGATPASWVERPLRQSWLTDPLAVDCAFQLLSLWCYEQAGAPSLPTRVGRYTQYQRSFPNARVRLVASVERPSEHRAVADVTFADTSGTPVARIEQYECVIDASLAAAFRRNRLTTAKSAPSPR